MAALARRGDLSAIVQTEQRFKLKSRARVLAGSRAARSVLSLIKELFARDLVVLHRVHADVLARDALAGGFWGDVEGEVNGELIGIRAVEERAGHGLAVECFVGDRVLRFLNHRTIYCVSACSK